MKKLTKNIFLVGLAVSTLTSCDNSYLDLEPKVSIDESAALNTSKDIQVTLNGAYDGLSDVNVWGGGSQYIKELLVDDRDVVFGGTFTTLDEIWRKTIATTNGDITNLWLDSYNSINRVNNVLSAISKVDDANRNRVEGEARFIRGALYFDLVNLYGKFWGDGDNNTNLAVPLILTPTRGITQDDYRTRATVAQVYAQVIDDLTKAEQLLSSQVDNYGFASKNAAAAMLSRVYLAQGNYALARDAANRVITSGVHALAPTFADAFADGSNTEELIFRIIVTDQDGANDLNTFYGSTASNGRGDIRVQSKFLSLYSSEDSRGKFFERVNNLNFTLKFADRYGDLPIIRFAEMYLTRAECNFRLGTTVGALPISDINKIRDRAGANLLTNLTLADILKERRLELAFEGGNYLDIKRTKQSVGALTSNSNALTLPIPQREIDTNKSLVQNAGY
ncbi:RagB/SusD family nutrient uptake outer membrane protein [Cellulophaga sp. BC115SP]|uniref:RagB/SusD family nutrient uptake outer membrane protein n=1 Tax=Cellulophaga sp. BC115SP TaxID=2683263 RepID=UPI001411ECEB|nr:RagB/SusD family nutrient uptake outer membrane protein [Cellulophaga sp. BC115SP]NBB31311.1 RagB/SusD family nutrient uptake outer membrane protein [Cellulophaga sp. BC115SP]